MKKTFTIWEVSGHVGLATTAMCTFSLDETLDIGNEYPDDDEHEFL